MDLEINRPVGPINLAAQEVKLAKLDQVLYLGQALKAVVLTPLNNGEVTIDINGQSINAKTSFPFTPGDTLDVKVVDTENEIVLQVQQPATQAATAQKTLQNALLQALPKQTPPTSLLDNLEQLVDPKQPTLQQLNKLAQLPPEIVQQIRTLLATIPDVTQLPQLISKIVNQSGVFLESTLLQSQPGMPNEQLKGDLKAQFLKLLNSLPIDLKSSFLLNASREENANPMLNRDPLPLPGAIPQPLHKDAVFNLMDKSPAAIQTVIHEQINQALSRITANQVNHLSQNQFAPDDNKTGFLIMMDIPVKTPQNDIDVIPLMIKQRKATATQPTQWSISFALSLSELGDMQGTVTLNGTNVNVKINTENQEAIDTLNQYEDEMHTLLEQLGLNLGGFNLKLGLENNNIQTENLHLLDIRI
jgi:hypothetical protein